MAGRRVRVGERQLAGELKGQPRSALLPPVLCYHRIGGPAELGVTRVAQSVFARQMTELARAGWRTLTLAEFSRRITHPPSRMPHPELLLSFDDGYASLAEHAYPVLADVGFTATTFLITDYVGRLNTWDARYTWHRLAHLDWDAIGRWRERGFDFASHTATHPRLTWLSDGRAAAELERSRETLRHRLGPAAAWAVAYPFGARDARIERLAGTAGYELGFGGVRGEGSPLALARLPVYMWDLGTVPFGLRRDAIGAVGRFIADVANRCAVGTSVMKGLGPQAPHPPRPPSRGTPCLRRSSSP